MNTTDTKKVDDTKTMARDEKPDQKIDAMNDHKKADEKTPMEKKEGTVAK